MFGLDGWLYCGNGKIGFNGGYLCLCVVLFDIYNFNIIIMMPCIDLVFIY